MTLGVDALTRFQSGTEVTEGTGVAATRIDYIEPGAYFKDIIENVKPNEARNSYGRNYRSFQVKRHWELSGMKWAPTFQGMARYMQAGIKGAVTGGAGDAGTPPMYTYTFKRTLTSDDLKRFTWEVGDGVQEWALSGGVLNKWDIGFTAGGPMTGSMDWMGLTSAKSTFTGALSDTVPEDIVGSLATVFIDTSTIGSTSIAADALDFKFSVDHGFQQLWTLGGVITPTKNYRPNPSKADLELKMAFDTTTEYDNFVSFAERKIRIQIPGAIIHDAVTSKLQVDWYGKWDAYDMGSDGGLHVASLKGESTIDSSFGADYQVLVNTALASVP